MKTNDIREKFLQFFQSKAHTVVASSLLVPSNDSSLLFTNSGMVQFKDVFLGFDKRPYHRAVTVQRCLRAGGKHNDLENVGYTARHHTFFEMLGNFSFGDYFKEKAIPYAWEFLTSPDWLGLDRQHLWVTVFGGGAVFGEGTDNVPSDDEAATLWQQTLVGAGFSQAEATRRITFIPTVDNFWMMGDTGPCGPCSEIFYDEQREATSFRGEDEQYADSCVEIWNLVFMQYNRDTAGTLHPLPAPCVDTGMGLERISKVMQAVESNYDTDLFNDLLQAVARLTGHTALTPSHRVIADHIRSVAFLIADGVLPANEGRGYVLRRIIRRGLRHLEKIQQCAAHFHRLVDPLVDGMGAAYPILTEKKPMIIDVLKKEEDGFSSMLKNGTALLDNEIRRLRQQNAGQIEQTLQLAGEVVFNLYDTYGFPRDMTAVIARDDYGISIDEAGFEVCMAQQRARSRAAMKFNKSQQTITYTGAATDFIGYQQSRGEAEVLAIFVNDNAVSTAQSGESAVIVLQRTPFYAESGGQIGDSGLLTSPSAQMRVDDTQKIRADVWGHYGHIDHGVIQRGDTVHSVVDDQRRANIACAHSATHLLHAALQQVLGKHVEQRGSRVSVNTIRFDFSHHTAMTLPQLEEVERIVNRQIRANAEVETTIMSYADALKTGAMALFGEKYSDNVRVVSIDKHFSMELCGGLHVSYAGNIGTFQIIGETAIAAGVRRVEAITAEDAIVKTQTMSRRLLTLAERLKTPVNRIEEKISQLLESTKSSQKQIQVLQAAQITTLVRKLVQEVESINGNQVLIRHIVDADAKMLRDMVIQLQQHLQPAAILLIGNRGGAAALVAAVSKGNTIESDAWLRAVVAVIGGTGGGKTDFAQSGGGDVTKIEAALQAARSFLQTN